MIIVIAEIGWNHCEDMQVAKKMIEAASISGATYAKFQTWSTKRLKQGEWDVDGRREIYEKAELSIEDHLMLKTYCAVSCPRRLHHHLMFHLMCEHERSSIQRLVLK